MRFARQLLHQTNFSPLALPAPLSKAPLGTTHSLASVSTHLVTGQTVGDFGWGVLREYRCQKGMRGYINLVSGLLAKFDQQLDG